MIAYREIVRDESDMTKVKALLDTIKIDVEIIILPIEKRDDELLSNAQVDVMTRVWDNKVDCGWDNV